MVISETPTGRWLHREFDRQRGLANGHPNSEKIQSMIDDKEYRHIVLVRTIGHALIDRMGGYIEGTPIKWVEETADAIFDGHDIMRAEEARLFEGFNGTGYGHPARGADKWRTDWDTGWLQFTEPDMDLSRYQPWLIEEAIRRHGDIAVPERFTESWEDIYYRAYMDLIRDSDKLALVSDEGYMFRAGVREKTSEPVISPEVISAMQKQKPVANKFVKTRGDFICRTLAMWGDLQFSVARQQWVDQQVSEQFLAILPHWGFPEEDVEMLTNSMDAWMTGKGFALNREAIIQYSMQYGKERQIGVYNLDA